MPRLTERLSAAARAGQYILGPEVEAFEARVRQLPRRAPRDRRRQRHRGDLDRAARARRAGRRRGGRALVHLLRQRRGGRGDRREAGLLRRRPGDDGVTPETVQGGAHAARRRRSSRCTCSATSRRSRSCCELGLPVLEDSAQATGATLDGARAGALGTRRDVLLLPVEEPALPRRRRRDHDRRRRGRRARAHPALPRLQGQADLHRGRLQLAPRRAAGRRAARAAAGARRLERAPAGRRRTPTSATASASTSAAAADAAAPSTSTTSTSCAASARTSCGALPSAASARPATTACRSTASRRWRANVELPGTEQAARTHLALPMGTELTDEQVREVVDACASGST